MKLVPLIVSYAPPLYELVTGGADNGSNHQILAYPDVIEAYPYY